MSCERAPSKVGKHWNAVSFQEKNQWPRLPGTAVTEESAEVHSTDWVARYHSGT